MYKRRIANQVSAALLDTPAVLLVGARQVGKSTLAHFCKLENSTEITLDDSTELAGVKQNHSTYISELQTPVLIDEVQRAPDILTAIKQAIDKGRLAGFDVSGSYLLTGSTSIWDLAEAPESMAGRIERILILPLSREEIESTSSHFIESAFKGELPAYQTNRIGSQGVAAEMSLGGYPEIIKRTDPKRQFKWYKDYINSVVTRDIPNLKNIRRPEILYKMLALIASRTGSPTNFEELGHELGISQPTSREYFELLERTYLLYTLPAWSRNIGTQVIQKPKVFLNDTGLQCHLLGYTKERLIKDHTTRPGPGAVFENFVALEISKQLSWRDGYELYHYREMKGRREIDIILENSASGKIVAIECKLASQANISDFKHLIDLQKKIGPDFIAGIVIYTGERTISFGKQLWAVPACALWNGA
jgi:predicted AAA+ superfamily ATPase